MSSCHGDIKCTITGDINNNYYDHNNKHWLAVIQPLYSNRLHNYYYPPTDSQALTMHIIKIIISVTFESFYRHCICHAWLKVSLIHNSKFTCIIQAQYTKHSLELHHKIQYDKCKNTKCVLQSHLVQVYLTLEEHLEIESCPLVTCSLMISFFLLLAG